MEIIDVLATAILSAIVILSFYNMIDYLKFKKLNDFKLQVYQLFLYAEKQGWIGKDKMDYVARSILLSYTNEKLRGIIKEETLAKYLQHMYDEFKESLLLNK